ncbi:MAG: poly-beta-1,6-N-acetyl-D-glucosamine N-deacetylase PgaB [Bordetella sp.]|uniref:poly-beta-1,6-N-acetyl-D-glucosamine N-deacetylase PgaB n=1 Tax=Bordetella sp. TaxID=28081 RepID=UPI003F7B5D34
MSLFLSRRRYLLLACYVLLLPAHAGDIPTFIPPAQRAVSSVDKPWPVNHFITLAYHDIEDNGRNQTFVAVRTDLFVAQMQWLHDNGYQPISIDQILAANQGGKPLPPKAVLLTFDDGFRSFYARAYPILKAYGWHAVWAPVAAWVGAPPDTEVNFGGVMEPRSRFATWKEVREVSQSGLVEIASHTYDQHMGIPANPQGNTEPAETTHRYDAATHTYETDAVYRKRIRDDARRMTEKLREVTGKTPRVWVWPYGSANGEAISIIRSLGYKAAFTLDDGLGNVDRLMSEPRVLVAGSPDMAGFAQLVLSAEAHPIVRVVQADLDYVYDPDPAQMDKNLGALVQRIVDMGVSTVFLQAYADPKGDGLVKSVYFPNRWLPMRADLFNRAVWQLQTRAHVKVYAWMPVLSFDLDPSIARVTRWDPSNPDAAPTPDPSQYRRLSPFDPRARAAIIGLYEDMARSAPIGGVLFHDDAVLGDFEDAGPQALAAYAGAGLPGSIQALRADPDAMRRWARFKSRYLIDFTRTLIEHVREVRGPQVKTARNIFAEPILDPDSEAWFAQNLNDFLQAYDWTVPMAMPLMEKVPAGQARNWLDMLVSAVKKHPGAMDRTIFELQSRDWSKPGEPGVDSKVLAGWMQQLKLDGVNNFGYYPDDFVRNQPAIKTIRPVISQEWYPYR